MHSKQCCIPSLYNMSLNSLVRWKYFRIEFLNELPGFIKEDAMRIIMMRGKIYNISSFLHPNIRKLDVSEYDITCQDLENIAQCTQIRVLEMNPKKFCRFDHPTCTLEMLASSLRHLVKLHIQRNDGMSDSVVQLLATNSCVLQELDVGGCTNLTDTSAVFLSNLPYIQAVNFSDTLIGNKGLIALSNGMSSYSLCELKLNNCNNVSDEGINAIVKGCNRLSILIFAGCPKVSVECQLNLDLFLGKDKKSKLITWTVYL